MDRIDTTLTRDVMTPDPAWLASDETADRAAALFAETGAGALPVCTRDGRPVGVVTDRDLVVRVLAQGADPFETPVGEVADGPPVVADAGETVDRAAYRLSEHGLRRLPVVEDGHLVGMLTRRDIEERLEGAERPDTGDHRSGRWALRRRYGSHKRREEERREEQRRDVADEARLAETVRAWLRP